MERLTTQLAEQMAKGAELDTEIRKYYPGDHKKRIHWKASARQQELLSRKYQHKPKAEIVLFMDMMKIKETELQIIGAEDKIIESILAVANFYALRGTPSQIIYDMDGKRLVNISTKGEFLVFYKTCVSLHFDAKIPVHDLIRERMLRGDEGLFYLAATHFLTRELYLAALQVTAGGNHLSVLFISDDVSEEAQHFIDSFKFAGISVYRILSKDEIADVLTGTL